jgi:hypothetical protein
MFLLEAIFTVLFVCANMGGAQWGKKIHGYVSKGGYEENYGVV